MQSVEILDMLQVMAISEELEDDNIEKVDHRNKLAFIWSICTHSPLSNEHNLILKIIKGDSNIFAEVAWPFDGGFLVYFDKEMRRLFK